MSSSAASLWTRARAMFARALASVGEIANIGACAALPPLLRRRIIAWLCPLEHIVRKLLLAEAAALHQQARAEAARAPRLVEIALRTAGPRVKAKPRHEPIQRRTPPHDPLRPETWSVQFALSAPRDPLVVANARAPRIRALVDAPAPAPAPKRGEGGATPETPRRLACRLEALRRVLADPAPHAARLARLIARAVRRFPEIARRYLLAPARTGDYDQEDPRLGVEAIAFAFDAPEAFSDSS